MLVSGLDGSWPDVHFDAIPNHQLLGAGPHHPIANARQPGAGLDGTLGFPLPLCDATAAPIRALALVDT